MILLREEAHVTRSSPTRCGGLRGRIKKLSLPLAGLFFLFACQQETSLPKTSASLEARSAFLQNSVQGYKKFLRKNPDDPYSEKAQKKLADLLLRENERGSLEDFARSFPDTHSLVQSRLDKFALIDDVLKRMNEHQAVKNDNANLSIRRGEPYYAYCYSKHFVGYIDQEEGEYIFSIKIERVIAPSFIKIVLLPQTFALAERFHSLSNIYYKIIISHDSPNGEYPAKVLFGLYRTIDDSEEERISGTSSKHVVKVVDDTIHTLQEIEVAAMSITHYGEKVKKSKDWFAKLIDPGNANFAAYYLYQWESSRYKNEIEKYKLFRSIAYNDLIKAKSSPDPTLSLEASKILEKMGETIAAIQIFTPFR